MPRRAATLSYYSGACGSEYDELCYEAEDEELGSMAANDSDSQGIPGPQDGRRRRFTNAEKRRILEEASRPDETVSSVGRRYGLSVSLLFRWRRLLMGATGTQQERPRTENMPTSGLHEEIVRLSREVSELQRRLREKTVESEELRRRLRHLGEEPTSPTAMRGVVPLARDG